MTHHPHSLEKLQVCYEWKILEGTLGEDQNAFSDYTIPRLREFPENSYLSVNSNSLPTRLILGKTAV